MEYGRSEPTYQVFKTYAPQTFYRLLRHMPPNDLDFMTNEQSGLRRRSDEDVVLFRGVSVRQTLNQILKLARSLAQAEGLAHSRLPQITHVARLQVRGGEGDCWARTLSTRGHHTVWAEPEGLRSRVTGVWTIQGEVVYDG